MGHGVLLSIFSFTLAVQMIPMGGWAFIKAKLPIKTPRKISNTLPTNSLNKSKRN